MKADPAFDLVRACLVWPPSAARDADVRAAAASVDDWADVMRLVTRHRIAGLVDAALDHAAAPAPSAQRDALQQRALREARRDNLMLLETARLQARLDKAQLPNLVLKGATLSALAYGRAGLKQSLDIDLLVLPEHVKAATCALEQAGYVRETPAPGLPEGRLDAVIALTREAAFRRRGDNLLVELQWRTDINPLWLTGVDARAPSQDAHLDGAPSLRTLAPDLLYAYLCAHGARHGFARLKWLADVAALLSRLTPPEIETLHTRAVALGVERASSLTLRLCQDLLGLDLPPELSARLARQRVLRPLMSLCRGFMAAAGATEASGGALYLYRLALLQVLLNGRLDQVWAELKLRWASPSDRLSLPLPPWADFLYPLLRLPLFAGRRLRAMISS